MHGALCIHIHLQMYKCTYKDSLGMLFTRMYASVPRCMPIARLGLIHNTMPSHIRTPFSKSFINICGRLVWHVCVGACHKGDEVIYLGHVFSANGMRPDEKKIAAVKEWPTPKDMLLKFVSF